MWRNMQTRVRSRQGYPISQNLAKGLIREPTGGTWEVQRSTSWGVRPERNKETILKPAELKKQCQALQRNRRGLKYSLYADLRKAEKGIVSCSSLQKGDIHEPRGDKDGPGRIPLETTCHRKNHEGKAKASGEERRTDTPEAMECINIKGINGNSFQNSLA